MSAEAAIISIVARKMKRLWWSLPPARRRAWRPALLRARRGTIATGATVGTKVRVNTVHEVGNSLKVYIN
ncbi:MAG TPA: hypothetical protein VN325_32320, partial [Steroidobacteraceae bacterium]|nr:hypothetical protein [Steroidobacteraceae bacterium]